MPESQAPPHVRSMVGKQSEPPKTTTPTVPASAGQDSMNRKLDFDSSEYARKRSAAEEAPDAPSFDLCTPPDRNEHEAAPMTDAIEGKTTTNEPTGPSGTSITPVEHAYQTRILKAGKMQKSPYIDGSKKVYKATKPMIELYNMVCKHTSKSRTSKVNDEIIIDCGALFAPLKHVADSVFPGKELVNLVAEIAIDIIIKENLNPKKVILPLRISVSSIF